MSSKVETSAIKARNFWLQLQEETEKPANHISNGRSSFTRPKSDISNQIDALEANSKTTNQTLNTVTQTKATLAKEVSDLKSQNTTNATKQAEVNAKIQSSIESQLQEINDLDQELKKHQKDTNADLMLLISRQQTDIKKLTEQEKTSQDKIKNLEGKLESQSSIISALQGSPSNSKIESQLLENYSKLEEENTSLKNRIKELEEKIDNDSKLKQKYSDLQDKKENMIKTAEKKDTAKKQTISKLEDDMKYYRRQSHESVTLRKKGSKEISPEKKSNSSNDLLTNKQSNDINLSPNKKFGTSRRKSQESNLFESRHNSISEIVSTEKNYVESLQTLKTNYLLPMAPVVEGAPKELQSKFKQLSNQLEVILNYNTLILSKLKNATDNTNSKKDKFDPCIGPIFLEFVNFLKVYTTYVNIYQSSMSALSEAKINVDFANFLQEVANEDGVLDLNSYLIMPVQRIPRYILLLTDLLKFTLEDHPDYQSISDALESMKSVADYVNERKREMENISQTLELNNHIEGKMENLAAVPSRRFIIRGPLTVLEFDKNQKVVGDIKLYFFLFNDILISTKAKQLKTNRWQKLKNKEASILKSGYSSDLEISGYKFKYLETFGVDSCSVDLYDSVDYKFQFNFSLKINEETRYFSCEEESERDVWVASISETIEKLDSIIKTHVEVQV